MMAARNGTPVSADTDADAETPRPNLLARVYSSMDIDLHTFLRMLKAAIPSTVAVAMYQADPIASEYNTIGYLVATIALYGQCCAPRGKYIQLLVQSLLCVCFGAASALLMVYCCVQARSHSSPIKSSSSSSTSTTAVPYNASASAVAGVWLFFEMYILNTLRADNPQLNYPVVVHNLMFNVAAVNAPSYVTMAAGTAFVTLLLKSSLTGLGLATATHFLILPDTSREIVYRLMGDYVDALQKTLKTHTAYFEAMQKVDMFVRIHTANLTEEKQHYRAKAEAIKEAARAVSRIHGNINNELPFAKREVAFGKLGPDDLSKIFKHLRAAMTPIIGLSTVVDIFERVMEWNNWDKPVEEGGVDLKSDEVHARTVHDWNMIMASTHDSFTRIIDHVNDGLQHVKYQLRFAKRPKKERAKDVEAAANKVKPGDDGFAEYLEAKSNEFYVARLRTLREWCEDKGIDLPKDYFDRPVDQPIHLPEDLPGALSRERNERQLYILLYVEHMLYSSSLAVLNLVRFADERATSGKLSRKRLVVPGSKRFRKWILSFVEAQDGQGEDSVDSGYRRQMVLDLGQAYHKHKDPEHLPPENMSEQMGEFLRMIPSFFRSTQSQFGARAAFASMTVGVIAFVESSRSFFISHRLVWAMIMATMGMSPTAAQTVSNFVFRCIGTVLAMIGSMLIWYIPNGHAAGVVVLLFIWTTAAWWVPLKRPVLQAAGIVSMTTTLIIIGYAVEVQKLGEETLTASGQEYYPTYLLAPYRLATVLGGLFVAFIWTVFPYPISDHSILRRDLGASLYLLAKYYSLVHEIMTARARGDEGDLALKTSAGRRLEKARDKVYAKQTLALNRLRTYSQRLRWEIPIGGRFPKERYDEIIDMVNYLNLVEFASKTFSPSSSPPPPSNHHPSSSLDLETKENIASDWFHDFTKMISTTESTSYQVASILALLSASILNAQPLPPYLKIPRPFSFSDKLKEVDKDVLNICHAAEPGYAAFSVLQVSSRCIMGDLKRLTSKVKDLVGELDFSFHVTEALEKED
ncbi:Dysferlin [Talaromyces islandicus]|uniref:Dysferlin n=1 Tax=Talaromyces islandicus TaxID=28573 RepID=A0A0U1M5F3_TALIS|nr:Dysferlin [Talaromyces islandicus]